MPKGQKLMVGDVSDSDIDVLDGIHLVEGDPIAKNWTNIRQTLRAFCMQSCPIVVPVDPAIRRWLDKRGFKITMTSMTLASSDKGEYYFYPMFTTTGEIKIHSDRWPDSYGFVRIKGEELGSKMRDDITSYAVHMGIIPLAEKIHHCVDNNKKNTAHKYKPGDFICGSDIWKFVQRLRVPSVDPCLFFGVVSATDPLAAPIPLRRWFSDGVEDGFAPLAQGLLAGTACMDNALSVVAYLPVYIGNRITEARKAPSCAKPIVENPPSPVRGPEPGDKRISAGTQTESPIPKKIKIVTVADAPVRSETCAPPQMTDSECLARVCALIGKDTAIAASRTQSPDRAAAIQRLAAVLHAFGDGTQSTVTAKKAIHGIFDAERKK